MPACAMKITAQVWADSERYAYRVIRHALDGAKLAEIVHIDSEVTGTEPDDDSEGGA